MISMLFKKFSSHHNKLLPNIQIRVVFKISLFSVGLLKMICLFIHFIFSQGSVRAQPKRETKMFREEKKDASLTTP